MNCSLKNITVSDGVSRVARHLRITPTMVDDFLIDPVMGVYVIFGRKLDAFQAAGLRWMWWIPDFMDSSGFGTGKTLRFWLFMNLRAVIIADQHEVAYYQTFQAAKDIFWPYYNEFGPRQAPIFNAQLGRMDKEGDIDGKDNTKGPACYKQFFKNESIIFAPAPNWLQEAKGEAGKTFNVAGIDEWTKVETMTKKTSRTTTESGNVVSGINQQILGRVRRHSFNQFHPLWGNHRVFLAVAEGTGHPGHQRYQTFEREVARGNPDYGTFTSCFKDFSNLPTETEVRIEHGRLQANPGAPFRDVVPNWQTIDTMQKQFTRAHFLREGIGIWARETKGWYTEDALNRCVRAGCAAGTEVECTRNPNLPGALYFEGVDSAPAQGGKADDGAKVVLRLRPKPGLGREPTGVAADWLFEYIWAYRVRGPKVRKEDAGVFFAQRTGDWSGLIHKKHQHFNFAGIMMDSQGGGQFIWPELNKGRQTIDGVDRQCTPIATVDDRSVGNAHFILTLFLRVYLEPLWPLLGPGVDSMLTAMHTAMQEAVEHAEVLFPLPFNERPRSTTEHWSAEQQWALKNLDAMRSQMLDIHVLTRDDGTELLTRNNAKQFVASKKKDLAYAGIYAYVRALLWLAAGELEFAGGQEGDPLIYGVNDS